ncbi:MAG TPA: replication initiator [Pseudonocardiaceae bacterium]|jgi:hypothetical protein|nr:replication initiator [Pseudonocardiaceae bacterium]
MSTGAAVLGSLDERLAERVKAADFRSWRGHVESTGGCAKPIHLDGLWRIEHAETGDTLAERSGVVMAPCGNRRASVCPACADRYAADCFHLLRAGLCGGKGIPASVAGKPRLFVTLTAPSFGPVHTQRRRKGSGKRIPCACGTYHLDADTRLGTPIDPGTYDYAGAVLWQAHSGDLWHRFTTRLRRELAMAAGIRVREIDDHARLSYAKVAEYQRRGLIHFHAVIRLDGPGGPDDPAPRWAHPDLLTAAVQAAARSTEVRRTLATPDGDTAGYRFTWGQQVDVKTIRPTDAERIETGQGEITDYALAGYIAKYATKGTSTSEAADRPIRSEVDIENLSISEHHRAMIQTAWDLGGLPGLGFLRRWAHMLGFRGHFLSKSKHYSRSFQDLRAERAEWRHAELLERFGVTDDDIIVINDWRTTGAGYNSEAERELASAIYERIREQRITKYESEAA